MNTLIESAELLIFDLDGTLYEDTQHFDYFASLLQEKLPADKQPEFNKTFKQMKAGKHVVKIGNVYDATRDAILTIDPMTEKATAVKDWEGRNWTSAEVEATYPEKLSFDFENLIAIGDSWWLPHVASRHFELPGLVIQDCYRRTKEFMATDQFELTKIPGLKKGLLQLGGQKKLVLITNSEQDDVARLLNELDLENLFDEIIPSAFKPADAKKHFREVLERCRISPEKAVSIGDNFINEIAPALSLGMFAIYIQPHERESETPNLSVVKRITDIF